MPEIKVGKQGIENWEEISHWAFCNDGTYHDVAMAACSRYWSEEQKLKTMIAGLLYVKNRLEK